MGTLKPIEFVLDLLFPPKCIFCSKILKQGEKGICDLCQRELPWITGALAEQKFDFVSLCVSPLWYQEKVRDSIHRYKFSDRDFYAKYYGRFIAQCVMDHLADRYDLITWVPLSAKSLKKRGYDQAMLLAMSAALELNDVAVETLKKGRHTGQQSKLDDDSARRANVLGAYEVTDPTIIQNKRILLIDDVVTTGSTLSECARVLLTHGASDIVCATLSRARN